MANVVSNASQGYGYNYASLSDIAMQGFEIPKMKTGTENGREYVYYFDKDVKEWIRGAEIVIPENVISRDGKPKMNASQLYGSALTYARRYTTFMALSLACEDDKKIEELRPEQMTIDKNQMARMKAMYSEEELKKLGKELGLKKLSDLPVQIFKRLEKEYEESHKELLQEPINGIWG